jgi:hypothetical protein
MTSLPIEYSDIYGNCLFISNSSLEFLDTCPRSMEYAYIYRRISTGEKAALNFGGGIHAGLAERYRSPEEHRDFVADTEVEVRQMATMDKYFEDHPLPLGDFRQPDLAKRLVQYHNRIYKSESLRILEHEGKPLVEFPFAFKLVTLPYFDARNEQSYITFIYNGIIDRIGEEDGQTFPVDTKTTSMMGEGFWQEQRINPQHEGYCWAWWKATGKPPAGYIVDGIRVRRPLQRDALGNSKRSTRADIEDDDFQRDKVYLGLERLMEWEENLKAKLETFLWYYSKGYFPVHKKWCVGKYGTCQYYDVCNLAQEFRVPTLLSDNFKDKVSGLDKNEKEPAKAEVDFMKLAEELGL